MNTDSEKIPLGYYRHYKGGVYKVLGFGRHTERDEYLVHYIDSKANVWFRPITMWNESVEYNGLIVPRFTYFDKQDVGLIEFNLNKFD